MIKESIIRYCPECYTPDNLSIDYRYIYAYCRACHNFVETIDIFELTAIDCGLPKEEQDESYICEHYEETCENCLKGYDAYVRGIQETEDELKRQFQEDMMW